MQIAPPPRRRIYTTVKGGGFTYASGTSISAPFVSGTAALALAVAQDQLGRTLSALELKRLIMDSAERLPWLASRSVTGGRLRTDWTLQRLLGKARLAPPTPCLQRPGTKKCANVKRTPGGGNQADGGAAGAPAAAPQQEAQTAAPSPAAAQPSSAAEAPAPAPEPKPVRPGRRMQAAGVAPY